MKTGDLITSYLNNEMNPEQEREFLLSVAASDSLRLALKSHVMLDRIVTRQAQQVHVPDAVRENIFAQMSASMSPASHGAHGGSSAPLSGNGGTGGGSAGLAGRSFWKFGRGAMVMLMTACSFAAGYYVHSQFPEGAAETATRTPAVQELKQGAPPATQLPAPSTASQAVTGQVGPAVEAAQERQQPSAIPQESAPEPSRAARQAVSSPSIVASRPAPRVINASHGPSTTGSRHVETIDEVKPEGTSLPANITSKPASAEQDQPGRTDPLNPPTNAKPTVTSGAQAPSVSVDGVTRDSHGNPQRVLPSQEGPE